MTDPYLGPVDFYQDRASKKAAAKNLELVLGVYPQPAQTLTYSVTAVDLPDNGIHIAFNFIEGGDHLDVLPA